MSELLKNLKTVLFAYISIIVLLFFAVLQSSQEKYDTAISQLNEIEKISASINNQAIIGVFNKQHPARDTQLSEVYELSEIGVVVKFRYQLKSFDFTSVKGKLQGEFPDGFNFGANRRTNLPKEFTETASVKSFLIPVLVPTSLASYSDLHNSTLNDVIVNYFKPDFSMARVEAYQYKSTSYNSIELVSTTEFEKTKIIDKVSMKLSNGDENSVCSLKLVKTKINSKYAFSCGIANVNIDNVNYSGVRLLIPSKPQSAEIKKDTLMSIFSISDERRLPFDNSYNELSELTKVYSDLPFSKIERIIKDEKNRNPSKLSIFGAEISVQILTKLIFPILIIMAIYTFLHLKEACRKIKYLSRDDIDNLDVPWVGLYSGEANKYAIFIQLIVFPIFLLALIQYKTGMDNSIYLSWVFFGILMLINTINYRKVLNFRNIMHNKSN